MFYTMSKIVLPADMALFPTLWTTLVMILSKVIEQLYNKWKQIGLSVRIR